MEYKFRGKRKDNNKWTYGSLIMDIDQNRIYVYGTGISHRVFPETIGMWAGLKDKNGIDIYEGDAYKNDTTEDIYQVMFFNGAFVGGKDKESCSCISWGPDKKGKDTAKESTDWMIVVGNIHDNPELLNPLADSPAHHRMFDPNLKAASEQEATNEQAIPEQLPAPTAGEALESAALNTAMGATQDSEEGSTEG